MREIKHIDIKKIVDEYYDIDISKKTRRGVYPEARFMYFRLCQDFCQDRTLSSIARSLNKNHATVLHGIKTIINWSVIDKRIASKYDDLYKKCELKFKVLPNPNSSTFHSFLTEIRMLREENKNLKTKIEKYERV